MSQESTERRSGLCEFHTVETDTEKACDVNVEVTAGFENRWADDDLSCRVG